MLQIYHYCTICLLLGTGYAAAQMPDSDTPLQRLAVATEGLAALESRLDRNDPGLAEALDALADAYMALNQFDAAHAALDRAVQITRLTEGLFTPAQLPFLQKTLVNYANQGDWQNARSLAAHLQWLYREKTPISAELLSQLLDLTELHLRGVVHDSPLEQATHFRQAMEANHLALLVATSLWGENDPRRAPVLYQLVNQHYLQTVAIDKGGETGYQLRELVPGSRWVYDRDTMRRAHYVAGMDLLRQMRAIFAQGEKQDPHGVAMVDLYMADWQVLYTQPEAALTKYNEAFSGLLAAGVERSDINLYFSIPEVLPASQLYITLQSAQRARESTSSDASWVSGEALSLQFNAGIAEFPNVAQSVLRQEWAPADAGYALFAFDLAGLKEVSRWINGSYRTAIGVVDAAEVLAASLNAESEDSELIRKLHTLRFRPRLLDGVPVHASGTLKYVMTDSE